MAHSRGCEDLLCHPQLHIDPAQARPQCLRRTAPPIRRSDLAACRGLNRYVVGRVDPGSNSALSGVQTTVRIASPGKAHTPSSSETTSRSLFRVHANGSAEKSTQEPKSTRVSPPCGLSRFGRRCLRGDGQCSVTTTMGNFEHRSRIAAISAFDRCWSTWRMKQISPSGTSEAAASSALKLTDGRPNSTVFRSMRPLTTSMPTYVSRASTNPDAIRKSPQPMSTARRAPVSAIKSRTRDMYGSLAGPRVPEPESKDWVRPHVPSA